jgi:hypothetical protein
MPFTGFRPYSFSPVSIRTNAPAAPGVYGISNAQGWIFVGATNNIQAALLEHRGHGGSAILAQSPTGFTYEACDPSQFENRRDMLIAELRPSCRGAA